MTPTRAVYSARSSSRSLLAARSVVVALARSIFAITTSAYASPIDGRALDHEHHEEEDEGDTVVLAVASLVLVLLGGAFAGLTIALMGQDGIYLQVIARDHTEPQHRNARRVYELLQRGKHWVLVTLLLSNVIVNETLPVVLDRCLGGGVAAVAGSTVLIVIFGEVIPQSLCVRYGLQIGGYMSQPVLLLMYLMAPLAWPTAKLLDWLLGEDHGTVYKKSGLKTLVTLHKTLGDVSDRLNQDEVTIISAVLDLKEKPVLKVMTPMEDVFTMSEDTVLDEQTMNMILSAGYSRIPIHETGHLHNFVGMLLVKILITYDPEDCTRVRDFPLATLPETRPETSCLDIVNFFQEGKSHMVLVSEYPGEDHGALGVVTLEDVIEELIGEEIIDESDVYIDVHKAIRRLAPAPRATIQPRASEDRVRYLSEDTTLTEQTALPGFSLSLSRSVSETDLNEGLPSVLSSSPKTATFMMRRHSGVGRDAMTNSVTVRANIEDLREHLKHLGPSNPATNPKSTKSTTVKVKPGSRTSNMAEMTATDASVNASQDESTRLLPTGPAGSQPRAIVSGYGSTLDATDGMRDSGHDFASETEGEETTTRQTVLSSETNNLDGSRGYRSDFVSQKKTFVRSGSITENIFETRGVRKVVLEPTPGQEDDAAVVSTAADQNKSKNRLSLGLFTSDRGSGDASLVPASPVVARDGGREGDSTEEKDRDDQESPKESSSCGAAQEGVKKKQRKKKRNKANQG